MSPSKQPRETLTKVPRKGIYFAGAPFADRARLRSLRSSGIAPPFLGLSNLGRVSHPFLKATLSRVAHSECAQTSQPPITLPVLLPDVPLVAPHSPTKIIDHLTPLTPPLAFRSPILRLRGGYNMRSPRGRVCSPAPDDGRLYHRIDHNWWPAHRRDRAQLALAASIYQGYRFSYMFEPAPRAWWLRLQLEEDSLATVPDGETRTPADFAHFLNEREPAIIGATFCNGSFSDRPSVLVNAFTSGSYVHSLLVEYNVPAPMTYGTRSAARQEPVRIRQTIYLIPHPSLQEVEHARSPPRSPIVGFPSPPSPLAPPPPRSPNPSPPPRLPERLVLPHYDEGILPPIDGEPTIKPVQKNAPLAIVDNVDRIASLANIPFDTMTHEELLLVMPTLTPPHFSVDEGEEKKLFKCICHVQKALENADKTNKPLLTKLLIRFLLVDFCLFAPVAGCKDHKGPTKALIGARAKKILVEDDWSSFCPAKFKPLTLDMRSLKLREWNYKLERLDHSGQIGRVAQRVFKRGFAGSRHVAATMAQMKSMTKKPLRKLLMMQFPLLLRLMLMPSVSR